MPLTALGPDGVIDATTCLPEQWAGIHRIGSRSDLRCRTCAAPMTAKISVRGLRFFAHLPEASPCAGRGETAEHRRLKVVLAEAIKAAGWISEVEAQPVPSDTGGWRADVMAIRPDGARRIAFEVQVAGMTVLEGKVRTDRYAIDGIETIWVTTKHAPWLHKLPSMRLVSEDQAGWTVDRGMAIWEEGRWKGGATSSLGNVVDGMLTSSLVAHQVRGLTETIARGARTIERVHHQAIALVPAEALVREGRCERQLAREQRERGRHERRIGELGRRQAAVLPALVADAFLAAGPGQAVFVGVPGVRIRPGRIPDRPDAVGNERTGFGVVAWIGSRRHRRLFGVGSPVAGRISPGLARSWSMRGIEVYAADIMEKRRLERALGPAVRVRVATRGPASTRPLSGAVSPDWSSDSKG